MTTSKRWYVVRRETGKVVSESVTYRVALEIKRVLKGMTPYTYRVEKVRSK